MGKIEIPEYGRKHPLPNIMKYKNVKHLIANKILR